MFLIKAIGVIKQTFVMQMCDKKERSHLSELSVKHWHSLAADLPKNHF